jgi:hypothetical protein
MARRARKQAESTERTCPLCLLTETLHAAAEDFRNSAVGKHLCNAEKEILLAMRAAIDQCIESTEGNGKKAGSRIQKVKVE